MVNIDRQPDPSSEPSSAKSDSSQSQPQAQAGPNYLSPSALTCFSECPKRYCYAYLERPEVADEVPTPHLVLGNALHKALAFLYRLPRDDRSAEAAARALRHYWVRIEGRDQAFESEGEERSWGLWALEALEWYCTSYDLEVNPRLIESQVNAELDNGEAIGGKVDRVDLVPELFRDQEGNGISPVAGLEVIDYKSGKVRLEDDDLPRDFGAQVYAVATSRALGQPVGRVRFIYLTEKTERRWEIEPEDLDAAAKRLEEATADVRFATEFPARPDFHCRWCRYAEICPDRDQPRLEHLDPDPQTPF